MAKKTNIWIQFSSTQSHTNEGLKIMEERSSGDKAITGWNNIIRLKKSFGYGRLHVDNYVKRSIFW